MQAAIMSQKQVKFVKNRKFGEGKAINEYYRTTIFSSDDVKRMAVERSRAKLIRQLVSKPLVSSGEFSSYFRGPKRQIDPVCSATSHTVNNRELKPNSYVIPTYPSLVNSVRWSSGMTDETSIYNSQSNYRQNVESSNSSCRCKACGGKHCRGLSNGEYKQKVFRDNITRFADNSTMTRKLNDACCGSCTPVTASRKTSEISVSSSDIAVRENNCAVADASQVYISCDPISILKKKRYESNVDYEIPEDDKYCTQTEKKCRIIDDFQEAVRDTEEGPSKRDESVCYEPYDSKPIRSFPKVVRNNPCDYLIDNEPRKNIYNEGISDLTINLLPTAPVYPEGFQAIRNLKAGHSRSSFLRKGTQRRDEVPFSHNTESRYHYSCKEPQAKQYIAVNDSHEQEMLAKKFRKAYISKPICNTESVKYPRKVLTSEKDIESYVGGQFMNSSNR